MPLHLSLTIRCQPQNSNQSSEEYRMDDLVTTREAGLPIVQVAWVVDDLQRAMSQW